MQEALDNRSEMDHASLEAQELWLACSALQSAIESNGEGGGETISVEREVDAVRKALNGGGGGDAFVSSVLAVFPGGGGSEASLRGVHSDSSIRERFLRVEKMAKRTAMLAEEDR